MDERRGFINGLVLGAAVGTALGLLFAPEGGAALRVRMQRELGRAVSRIPGRGAVGNVSAALGDVKAGVQLGLEGADVRAGVQLGVESASERLRGTIEEPRT